MQSKFLLCQVSKQSCPIYLMQGLSMYIVLVTIFDLVARRILVSWYLLLTYCIRILDEFCILLPLVVHVLVPSQIFHLVTIRRTRIMLPYHFLRLSPCLYCIYPILSLDSSRSCYGRAWHDLRNLVHLFSFPAPLQLLLM